ncbi:hypothetical protein ASPBRDRAFT_675999 [Aspergillus brasiliensis CBS 101740]|uniref:Uncharacterized protein n=1 Tax=Aspergillus brasiliensis (strain CBS 101740 / IMI 381727 / IBT 21946) TaxID=767769 RepID=A0A1L9UHP5_ASPBC|nr:hypothetical protein ASPBRDRAFT_675999 [Aspergillus brasiliensis CBS 101740]
MEPRTIIILGAATRSLAQDPDWSPHAMSSPASRSPMRAGTTGRDTIYIPDWARLGTNNQYPWPSSAHASKSSDNTIQDGAALGWG